MKSYIVTYCKWSSYGAMLQSLGLKRALASLDIDSELIQIGSQKPFAVKRPGSLKDIYRFSLSCINRRKLRSGYEKGMKFYNASFDVLSFTDYERLCADRPRDGVYIAGSDQIWNPKLSDSVLRFHFMDFAVGCRKLSYAASMGYEKLSDEKKAIIKPMLSGYESISVREEGAKKALQPLAGQDIQVHIDPTFLLTADDWRACEKPYPVKGGYILLYAIYWNRELNGKLKLLQKQTGLPVIAIKPAPSTAYATRTVYDAGPAEFLWLIDHADYVVTSSFHGAAFSVIFQKQFSMVIDPSYPSRAENLLKTLSVPKTEPEKLASSPLFDYETVSRRISEERSRAYDYLRKALL